MSKKIVILLLLGLLLLGGTQLAYAAEVVVNEESDRACFLDYLSPEARERAENIIRDFHQAMTALRHRMAQIRGTGDWDARDEVRDEMREVKEDRQEAISELLPEEYRDEYLERGFQGQKRFRPEGHGERVGRRGSGQNEQPRENHHHAPMMSF